MCLVGERKGNKNHNFDNYCVSYLCLMQMKIKKKLWVWLVQHYKWQTCMVRFKFTTMRWKFLGFVHKCQIWLSDSTEKFIIISLIRKHWNKYHWCNEFNNFSEMKLTSKPWHAELCYKHKLFCKTVAAAVYYTLLLYHFTISLVLYLCCPQLNFLLSSFVDLPRNN